MVEAIRVRSEPSRDLTAKEAKRFRNAQVPYPNFATNQEIARRAAQFVLNVRRRWERDSKGHRTNWMWQEWLFRGNSIRGAGRDVHVPELLKSHRSLYPRLIEAFFGNGSNWFEAVGSDGTDRQREAAITTYLESELERNNFIDKMTPATSTALKTGVMCFKCTYERRTRKQVYHWIEEEVDESTKDVVEVHYREWRDVVYREGNVIRLVDPNRLIVDCNKWELDDLDYIGDFGLFPVDETLKQTAVYKNLDQLAQMKAPKGASTEVGRMNPGLEAPKPTADAAERDESQKIGLQGGRQHTEITDLWCWFNFASPSETPDWRDAVITVADNSVCLRVQENFHDDKHKPYAIGRSSENGFQFYDVGLYAPALRVQDEIDNFRSLVSEAVSISVRPKVFVSGVGSDLPTTLMEAQEGEIMRDVGNVTFQPIPTNLQFVPLIDSMLRRDIEEIIGAPRIWQGTESSPGQETTATEVRRKIEEGNRRLLGHIRMMDSCVVQLLRIMHANSQQFLTKKTKYRLMSQRYARLLGGGDYEIKPSELMHSVDFTIYGVRRVATYGLRGTNLMTFFQALQPVLDRYPDLVNLKNLIREAYRSIVGNAVDDDVLNDLPEIEAMQSQDEENKLLLRGIRVQIDPRDDDAAHLRKMEEDGLLDAMASKETRKDVQFASYEHAQLHLIAMKRKRVQEQARQEQLARRREEMAAEDPNAGSRGGETPDGPAAEAVMQRGARQTNGPGTEGQVPRAGRSAPIEQTRNE